MNENETRVCSTSVGGKGTFLQRDEQKGLNAKWQKSRQNERLISKVMKSSGSVGMTSHQQL
jgi:hypothetical protein